jgi:hypothetical protein
MIMTAIKDSATISEYVPELEGLGIDWEDIDEDLSGIVGMLNEEDAQ